MNAHMGWRAIELTLGLVAKLLALGVYDNLQANQVFCTLSVFLAADQHLLYNVFNLVGGWRGR